MSPGTSAPEVTEDQVLWQVTGGGDKGGIIVREGRERTSPQAPARLATGATVVQQRCEGDRLCYRLVRGSGPDTGWVSVRMGGKDLVVQVSSPACPVQERDGRKQGVDVEVLARGVSGRSTAAHSQVQGVDIGRNGASAPKAPGDQVLPEDVADIATPKPHRLPPSVHAPSSAGPPKPDATTARAAPGTTAAGKYSSLPDDDLRKACKDWGFYPGALEQRVWAPSLLEQIESVSRKSFSELRNEICRRSFAPPAGCAREDAEQRLRDVLLWEHFRHGELRRACRDVGLPPEELSEATREELLEMLRNATWQSRGVPVWRLASHIMGYGVLDQVDRIEAKPVEELALLCERRGLPLEDELDSEVLVDRLRTLIVWDHLPVEELRVECQAMGLPLEGNGPEEVKSAGSGFSFGGASRSGKDQKAILIERLSELFWQAPAVEQGHGLLPDEDPRFPEQVSNFLALLGMSESATPEDLKRAYRDAARRCHPDKNPGEEERVKAEFQAVSEAYESLLELMRRRGLLCGA